MRAILLAVAFLAVGCHPPSSPAATQHVVAARAGFACDAPSDWSMHEERGAVVFVSTRDTKRTIAIRGVPLGDKTDDDVYGATRFVLNGLPQSHITSKRAIDGELTGVAYELTFVPPGMHSKYERTHVVLVGAEHIFHIIETAPVGTPTDDSAVDLILSSLHEEADHA